MASETEIVLKPGRKTHDLGHIIELIPDLNNQTVASSKVSLA